MAFVRCVHIRRASINPTVNGRRRFIDPKNAIINRQGNRGLDNGEFLFDPTDEILEGDEIYYIQDVTDVESLVGMWNFWGSFRDESGFENDDYVSSPYTLPVGSSVATDASGKFRGKHKMNILADGGGSNTGVRIPNKNSVGGTPFLDFGSNFDIYFEFKKISGSNNTPVIFDKYDTITDTGIKISFNITGKTITVDMGNGTTTKTVTTPLISAFDVTVPQLIRVAREGETITIWLDNILVKTDTYTSGGSLNTSKDLYLFTEFNDNTSTEINQFSGRAYQLRIYNSKLTTDEASKIFNAKPQTMTMKFGGRVWKVADSGTSKKVIVNGFGNILLNTHINSNILSGSVTFSNGSKRDLNVFHSDPSNPSNKVTSTNILTEIIENIGKTDEYVLNLEKTASFQFSFVAEGMFIDIINIILQMATSNRMFTVNPRKVIIFDTVKETNLMVSDSNFRLLDDGKDNTTTINRIIGVGRATVKTAVTTSGLETISLSTSWSTEEILKGLDFFEAYPISIISVTSDEGGSTTYFDSLNENASSGINRYIFNQATNRIRFRKDSGTATAAFTVTFSYRYEKSPAASNVQIKKDQDSIDANGEFSAKLNLPQLTNGIDISTLLNNIITDSQGTNRRIRAESRALINSIGENEDVRVYYAERGIGTQHPTTFVESPITLTVKSIRYTYPNTMTTIELGEYLLDSFDLETISTEALRQTTSNSNENNI